MTQEMMEKAKKALVQIHPDNMYKSEYFPYVFVAENEVCFTMAAALRVLRNNRNGYGRVEVVTLHDAVLLNEGDYSRASNPEMDMRGAFTDTDTKEFKTAAIDGTYRAKKVFGLLDMGKLVTNRTVYSKVRVKED